VAGEHTRFWFEDQAGDQPAGRAGEEGAGTETRSTRTYQQTRQLGSR